MIKDKIIKINNFVFQKLRRIKSLHLRVFAKILLIFLPKDFYKFENEFDIKKKLKSKTIFIFGSGSSICDLNNRELKKISNFHTMGCNYFAIQDFIRLDFQVFREMGRSSKLEDQGKIKYDFNMISKFSKILQKNKKLQNTIFFLQTGFDAWATNIFIGLRFLKKSTKIFLFSNTRNFRSIKTSNNLNDPIYHGSSTITDCIHLAYLLGFNKIILCGVDLNNRHYFWNQKKLTFYHLNGVSIEGGEYSGNNNQSESHRSKDGLVRDLKKWNKDLKKQNIKLYTLSAKSALSEFLPTFNL